MRPWIFTLRASAAACLLLAASASPAASPSDAEDGVALLQSAFARSVTPGEQADLYRELLATVLHRVQRSYATEVDVQALTETASRTLSELPPGAGDPGEVFNKAINAALATLDRYSRYLDPRSRGNERDAATGSFGGLGLEVEAGEGVVRVVAPMPDGPAARAGLQAGDLIVRVDDQPLQGVSLADAIAKMRGQPGTPVAITIRRTGRAGELTLSLTRETIRRQVVRWNMEGEVLVLRLGTFTGSVTALLQQAITEASTAKEPRAAILDLRGNPGGLLREAVKTADIFLADGVIASVRGRTPGNQRTWQADAEQLLAGVPLVVLIDGRSASASELVAAALQENGRATVMGQKSFGKGTVQTTFSLGEEIKGALKLTTSYYHGPSGRAVQKTGVMPDIELAAPAVGAPPEASVTTEFRTPLARVDPGRCTSAGSAPDPALACALRYLQAGSLEAFVTRLAGSRP